MSDKDQQQEQKTPVPECDPTEEIVHITKAELERIKAAEVVEITRAELEELKRKAGPGFAYRDIWPGSHADTTN